MIEQYIAHARKEFENILTYVTQDVKNQQLHEVEGGIFSRLLKLGGVLLVIFIQNYGDGSVGKSHTDNLGIKRLYHSLRQKVYTSIFGKIVIQRASYWKKGYGSISPLDAQLNLPQNQYSYLLQEWGMCLSAEEPYKKAADFLQTILGIPLFGEIMKRMSNCSKVNIKDFYDQQSPPNSSTESELLVATADGKGIRMRKDQINKVEKKELRKTKNVGNNNKAKNLTTKKVLTPNGQSGKKKVSTVTALYTIDRHKRTAKEIIGKKGKLEESNTTKRPSPQNKMVKATLKGKEVAFEDLKNEAKKRSYGHNEQTCVSLVDGEHKLRELFKEHLPSFCVILDLYHVLEYLWTASSLFHRRGTKNAENWVTEKLQMLLYGDVEKIILQLKLYLQHNNLSKSKSKTLQKIITYFDNGKEHMRYDEYIAKGYPIGSGVIEGTCKNLVNDRMELSGMHWTISGAETILQIRSICLNGLCKDYWKYHVMRERKRIYSSVTIEEQQIMGIAI